MQNIPAMIVALAVSRWVQKDRRITSRNRKVSWHRNNPTTSSVKFTNHRLTVITTPSTYTTPTS